MKWLDMSSDMTKTAKNKFKLAAGMD
jgi:hypothetical protein